MIQVSPQTRILVAVEAVDFGNGIDGLARVCQERLQSDPGPHLVDLLRKSHAYPPSDPLPIHASLTKFGRFWAFVVAGRRDADGHDASIHEREDDVPWCYFPHGFVEGL